MNPSDRLIVAADFSAKEFGGILGVHREVLSLAKKLEGLGVYIKVNSVLRAVGYGLIGQLHDLGLKVFADLKLNDIPNTMDQDAQMLLAFKPELLTVMCSSGVAGMASVQKVIGNTTEVLGVTVLTSLSDVDCQEMLSRLPIDGVRMFAGMAQRAGLGGLILSPQEAEVIKKLDGHYLTLNTPGIRPLWSIVEGDDQARVMTPAQAIAAGVDRIVVGRPITQDSNPRDAVLRTLAEISS